MSVVDIGEQPIRDQPPLRIPRRSQIANKAREQVVIECSAFIPFLNADYVRKIGFTGHYHFMCWSNSKRKDYEIEMSNQKKEQLHLSGTGPGGEGVKFTYYESTLDHGWIPDDPLELLALLLQDIDRKWDQLFKLYMMYLDHRRITILAEKGRNTRLIDHLLHDGLQLPELSEVLELQVGYISKILHNFVDHMHLLEGVKESEKTLSELLQFVDQMNSKSAS